MPAFCVPAQNKSRRNESICERKASSSFQARYRSLRDLYRSELAILERINDFSPDHDPSLKKKKKEASNPELTQITDSVVVANVATWFFNTKRINQTV